MDPSQQAMMMQQQQQQMMQMGQPMQMSEQQMMTPQMQQQMMQQQAMQQQQMQQQMMQRQQMQMQQQQMMQQNAAMQLYGQQPGVMTPMQMSTPQSMSAPQSISTPQSMSGQQHMISRSQSTLSNYPHHHSVAQSVASTASANKFDHKAGYEHKEKNADGTPKRLRGIVKHWLTEKGYGFIYCEEKETDHFCHNTCIDAVEPNGFRSLASGMEVEYELIYNDQRKKMMAINVTLPGGGKIDHNNDVIHGFFDRNGIPTVGDQWTLAKPVREFDVEGYRNGFKIWEFNHASTVNKDKWDSDERGIKRSHSGSINPPPSLRKLRESNSMPEHSAQPSPTSSQEPEWGQKRNIRFRYFCLFLQLFVSKFISFICFSGYGPSESKLRRTRSTPQQAGEIAAAAVAAALGKTIDSDVAPPPPVSMSPYELAELEKQAENQMQEDMQQAAKAVTIPTKRADTPPDSELNDLPPNSATPKMSKKPPSEPESINSTPQPEREQSPATDEPVAAADTPPAPQQTQVDSPDSEHQNSSTPAESKPAETPEEKVDSPACTENNVAEQTQVASADTEPHNTSTQDEESKPTNVAEQPADSEQNNTSMQEEETKPAAESKVTSAVESTTSEAITTTEPSAQEQEQQNPEVVSADTTHHDLHDNPPAGQEKEMAPIPETTSTD